MACRNAENTALHGAVGTAAISELRNQINTSILPSMTFMQTIAALIRQFLAHVELSARTDSFATNAS